MDVPVTVKEQTGQHSQYTDDSEEESGAAAFSRTEQADKQTS